MIPRLQQKYHDEIIPQLKKDLGYASPMQVPKLVKISINQSIGEATKNTKLLNTAQQEITAITGQKAFIIKSKRAISNFSLRIGMPIAVAVTLRNKKMYEFLDRLISLALPRVRDFRGVSKKSFDKHGNYTLGIKSQIIFPEIKLENINKPTGMDITFVTTAQDKDAAHQLLKAIGLPF